MWLMCGERGIGLNRRFRVSKLGIELGLASLVAAVIGLVVYIGLNAVGYGILDRRLMREDILLAREEKCIESLQEYVSLNGLSSEDRDMLDEWAAERKNMIITLYKNKNMLYSNDKRVAVTIAYPEDGTTFHGENITEGMEDEEDGRGGETEIPWVYRIRFSDGYVDAVVSFYYEVYYYMVNALNSIIAVLAFMVLLLLFIHKKVKYIALLEQEIHILEGGDLNYNITVKGRDELTSLAAEIDAMRQAIRERQMQEEMARNANRDLVTAMSHDLRTPLTSLLGYVDILQMGRCEKEEEYRHCLAAVKNKAYQIKELSDKIFEYFIVYGKDEEELELSEVNGTEFLGQIVEESLFDMENEGFSVERICDEINCRLMTDIRLIRRVFDNIFSNLLKYADISRPVRVEYRQTKTRLLIRFTNYVALDAERKESSCIGLKTCEKIMKCHQGVFRYSRDGELFTVELEFPAAAVKEA